MKWLFLSISYDSLKINLLREFYVIHHFKFSWFIYDWKITNYLNRKENRKEKILKKN